MIAFATLISVLAIAATVGWAVRWLTRRVRSRLLRWALSLSVGLLALFTSGAYLLYRGLALPAEDASIFQDRSSVAIELLLGAATSDQPDVAIEVAMPKVIRIYDDAAIDLLIRDSRDHLPAGTYTAVLEASSELETRTPDACVEPLSRPNAVTACYVRSQVGTSQFRWFLRSGKPGTYYITVKFPYQLAAIAGADQPAWLAGLRRDGAPLTQFAARPEARPSPSWNERDDWSRVREMPAPLSAQKPVFREQDLEIDLRSQQVTFPLQFETTLGVTGTTYDTLTLLGALASGALGGGWLWQLLSWMRAHPRKPAKKGEFAA